MKKMNKEKQILTNGGLTYYGYCVMGDYNFKATSKAKLQQLGYAHYQKMGSAHRWNYL